MGRGLLVDDCWRYDDSGKQAVLNILRLQRVLNSLSMQSRQCVTAWAIFDDELDDDVRSCSVEKSIACLQAHESPGLRRVDLYC